MQAKIADLALTAAHEREPHAAATRKVLRHNAIMLASQW